VIVFKLAVRRLVRSPRNSLVLIGLVGAGVFLFILGDVALGSAATGIRTEFREGYTGDLAIRAKYERKFGIFGFSMPMIGEYEEIPILGQVPEIRSLVAGCPGVVSSAGLVSGASLLEGSGGYQVKVPVFGVKAEEYFRFFPSIRFVSGTIPRDDEAWIVLPRSRADEIGRAEGRQVSIGETLQLTMASGNAFTIRAVRLAGIVETSLRAEAAIIPVYIDPVTLRALLGLATGLAEADSGPGFPQANDLESYFSEPKATTAQAIDSGEATGLGLLDRYLSNELPALVRPDPEKGSWHFLLVRLGPGESSRAARRTINRDLKNAGIAAEAVDWLAVASLNAGTLVLLKTLFEIGIGVLAAVVVLVLTNGLAFSVLEQTQEIGAIRAMGGQKGFVRKIYLLQALILVGTGAAAGILAGVVVLRIIGSTGIPIGNNYLYELFGTRQLVPVFRYASLLTSLCGSALVAVASSIYPIALAMRTSIVETMASE
jgi:putative ABC transport system permease protein